MGDECSILPIRVDDSSDRAVVSQSDGEDVRAAGRARSVYLALARQHLRDADPVIARLIEGLPEFDPQAWLQELPPMDLFGALLFQVVGQQLSVAATRRTLSRIEAMFDGRLPVPAELVATDPAALRGAGLSWRKIETLRDLAARLIDGRVSIEELSTLPDDEIIAALTEIPGIGPWTAQGALIIALERQDVVLPGDLALRKAIQAAYELDRLPSSDEVVALAEKWRPYRTLATGYLFASAFEQSGVPGTATTSAVPPSKT
jgi:DNA-3-methyladenine glycosylase II